MPPHKNAAIPAAPRKTLLKWIDHEDGDTTDFTQPACSEQVQAFHARILLVFEGRRGAQEPLQPPPGLRLAPLG